jgi:hypothetical protein
VVDPTIAGLKEEKQCRERAFLTLPPDSDRNDKSYYDNPIQSVKPEICAFAAVVSTGFSTAHTVP